MFDSSHPIHLAAVILTRNVAGHITDCIATLGFADRVVVSDSFSDDNTVALAQAAGAEVMQRTFDNFAGQRNAAMEAVAADWIFFVDADERIPPELAAEVRQVIAERSRGRLVGAAAQLHRGPARAAWGVLPGLSVAFAAPRQGPL